MADIYNDIRQSLLRYCNQFISDEGLQDFIPFDFDAHATIDSLPARKNLIGVAEYSLQNDDKTYEVSCMLVVSTMSTDSGNVILNKTVGKLFSKLRPAQHLTTVNGQTGVQIGRLVVMSPVVAMPVAATEGRPFLGIAVRLGSTIAVPQG